MIKRSTLVVAAVLAALVLILVGVLTGQALAGVPMAVGLGVLYCQYQAATEAQASFRERDDALPLLQGALPKMQSGLPIDAAFIAAAATQQTSIAGVVATYCARARQGLDLDGRGLVQDSGPIAAAIVRMISAARANGGETARPFASLATMIETDQRLRRRQQIATLHVRAQANALGIIAGIVVVFVLAGNTDGLAFLRETYDGRMMLLFSLTSILWGYVVLTALTARISNA